MPDALVVDDNRSTADSMVKLLKALGLNARAAYGPIPAMSLLNMELPDLIILDLNMPGISGFEVLSYLTREPRLNKVPVFVCTSDDQPQTQESALAGGAREFLVKPVTLDILEAALKRAGLL